MASLSGCGGQKKLVNILSRLFYQILSTSSAYWHRHHHYHLPTGVTAEKLFKKVIASFHTWLIQPGYTLVCWCFVHHWPLRSSSHFSSSSPYLFCCLHNQNHRHPDLFLTDLFTATKIIERNHCHLTNSCTYLTAQSSVQWSPWLFIIRLVESRQILCIIIIVIRKMNLVNN